MFWVPLRYQVFWRIIVKLPVLVRSVWIYKVFPWFQDVKSPFVTFCQTEFPPLDGNRKSYSATLPLGSMLMLPESQHASSSA